MIEKAFPELFLKGLGGPWELLTRIGEKPGVTRKIKFRERVKLLRDRTDTLNKKFRDPVTGKIDKTKRTEIDFRFANDSYFIYYCHNVILKDELINNICIYMKTE